MKRSLFLILMLILCAAVMPVTAQEKDEPEVTVNVNGAVEMFLVDVDGLKFGIDPEKGTRYNDIAGAEISSNEAGTTLVYPDNNTYLIWMIHEDSNPDAFNAQVTAKNWSADLTQLIPLDDNPTMIITDPRHFISESGPLFEKLTIIAHPDAFPVMNFKTLGTANECTLTIDPTFEITSTSEELLKSESEMVFTYFPEEEMISLWISALASQEAYIGNQFILNTKIECVSGDKMVTAQSVDDHHPILRENGIFYITFNELIAEKAEFFQGDLDGDDIYETVSGENYFDITTASVSN